MGEALALSRDFGIIKAGELLALPGSVSARSAKQISVSAGELIRNISGVLENLVLSVIEKRTAAEFETACDSVFPQYMNAVLALSSLIQILVPQSTIERLNWEGFSELEAAFRDRGLTAFGSDVRDQSMFTVWTLRKISDYMSQIAGAHPLTKREDLAEASRLAHECMFHAIRTRFHIHCLTTSMESERPVHPEALGVVIDGLRSVVNAFGLARRLLDLTVPLPAPQVTHTEWDDEDIELLAEATRDTLPEIA